MIYNPYAKKRPRPSGQTSSNMTSPSSFSMRNAANRSNPGGIASNHATVTNGKEGSRAVFHGPNATDSTSRTSESTRSDHSGRSSHRMYSNTKESCHQRMPSTGCNSRTFSNPYAKRARSEIMDSKENQLNTATRRDSALDSFSRPSGASHSTFAPPTTWSNLAGSSARTLKSPTEGSSRSSGTDQEELLTRNDALGRETTSFAHSSHHKMTGSKDYFTTQSQMEAMNKTKGLPSRTMASMRPDTWKRQTAVGPSQLSTNHHRDSTQSHCSSSSSSVTSATSTTTLHQQSRNHNDPRTEYLPPELAYRPEEVKPIQDEYRMTLIQNARLSDPLQNGWRLFPHQKKAIIRALTMRRMILALDMGLGKTLIGAVWSRAFQETFGRNKLKIFVICPVSLKEEWKRTAEEKVGGLFVEDTEKTKRNKGKGSTAKRNSKTLLDTNNAHKISICSWAKVPKKVDCAVEHFVVCCDEAHAMQSAQAQRTKDVLNLVYDERCVGVLLLTGTPMKNGKPGNLFPLLKAVRHPLGRHQKAYEAHFCNGMIKNFGRGPQWDASGASNLDQLKRKVASNLLHMTKEQCLKALPPMRKIFHDVPVSARFQVQYEQAIKYLAGVQANSSNMKDEAVLGAVQRLRVVCAHAKIDATVELARKILATQPAVVVFTYFAQVAKTVHSKLTASGWPCCLLTGETLQTKRQDLVDRFQKGLSSVFVCTFGAGGVGLTLTAASTIVLLDRPWTPGETMQAEDRIRRIGQTKDCTSYWIRSFDLDKQIDEIVEAKSETTNAVLDRTSHQSVGSSSSFSKKISINQLVHKFVLSESRKQVL